MQYLLLIYEDEKIMAAMDQAAQGQLMADYNAFTKSVKDSGAHRAGEALTPTSTATTVRVREQLGGFYLVEAKDLDEATAIAAKIPTAKTGSIEVRPIVVWG